MVLGDNGQVVKQGTYSQVQDKIDEAFQSNDNQLTQVDKEAETNNIVDIPVEPPIPTPDTPAATKDRQRKSTELSVYKYYFSALGWPRVAILLLFLL